MEGAALTMMQIKAVLKQLGQEPIGKYKHHFVDQLCELVFADNDEKQEQAKTAMSKGIQSKEMQKAMQANPDLTECAEELARDPEHAKDVADITKEHKIHTQRALRLLPLTTGRGRCRGRGRGNGRGRGKGKGQGHGKGGGKGKGKNKGKGPSNGRVAAAMPAAADDNHGGEAAGEDGDTDDDLLLQLAGTPSDEHGEEPSEPMAVAGDAACNMMPIRNH